MGSDHIVAIFGPTGVGKTKVAIELAELLRERGERPVAVSCDALQVYRGLEILTGVASAEEQRHLEHRLVSFRSLDSTFSAGEYAALAHKEIDYLIEGGSRPIVIGGTGLYLRAALSDLDLKPPVTEAARIKWQKRLDESGVEALHSLLIERAPWVEGQIAPTDTQRVLRALELDEIGELTPRESESELWTETTRRPTTLVGLTMEREALYRSIENRIDQMIDLGVQEEVRAAEEVGVSLTARKALGFEDLLNDDVESMKRRTRQYAKRQLTWMRKLPSVQMIDVEGRSPSEVAEEISRLL